MDNLVAPDIKAMGAVLYSEIKKHRKNSVATLEECEFLIKCWLKSDYEAMRLSNVYKNAGGEYCEMLELIPKLF